MGAHADWPVFCEHCFELIEACDGLHGEWMHGGTRREFCSTGDTLAFPSERDKPPVKRAGALSVRHVCPCGAPFHGGKTQTLCPGCRASRRALQNRLSRQRREAS